jgi:hypothetical protein
MNGALDYHTISAATTARYDLHGLAHGWLRHAHAVMFLRLARADYMEPQGGSGHERREHLLWRRLFDERASRLVDRDIQNYGYEQPTQRGGRQRNALGVPVMCENAIALCFQEIHR